MPTYIIFFAFYIKVHVHVAANLVDHVHVYVATSYTFLDMHGSLKLESSSCVPRWVIYPHKVGSVRTQQDC